MFKRYLVMVYFADDIIFMKAFKSINNAIKVLTGFDHECSFEIEDQIFDKTMCNYEVKELVRIFTTDNESEDY